MPTITSKGQVTIPKDIRESLGLKPGDRVSFRIKEGHAIVEAETIDLRDLAGSIKPRRRAITIEMMDEAIRAGRGRGGRA